MSWIEVKTLRQLMKVLERKPNIGQTVSAFNQQYFFRTTLKVNDCSNLASIA